jgi:adenylate kinase
MRLILLGPPGSGKGTQASLLARRNGLAHIATGDLLRAAIQEGTPAGLRARPYVEAGKLVPDDVVNAMVAERFRRFDRPPQFVMDGYPRNVPQAETFDALLKGLGLPLTAVLLLQVDDDEIVRRLAGRRVCPNPACKTPYHLVFNPPKVPGVCDVCGTPLIHREDDKEETVRRRLTEYHQNTEGLIPYYRARGLLRAVPGEGDIEAIYQDLLKAIHPQAGPPC